MFDLEDKALEFIEQNGSSAVIGLKFVHCIGDAICVSRRLLGSQVPTIRLGEPENEETVAFHTIQVRRATIYYHQNLGVKFGASKIRVTFRNLFWWRWLEIEGAKLTPVFDD